MMSCPVKDTFVNESEAKDEKANRDFVLFISNKW